MSEKIIKRDLIKELDLISATDFESVCFELIKKKHPDEIVVHNGINIDDRPVKSTLDVNSGDLGICLECSVEKDYFIDNGYKKIEHDLQHISKLSGRNLKKVYLCCSKVEPPSFRAAWIKSNPYKNYKNYNIDILDGKKIVDEIYEYSIQRGSMYDFFGRYLPKFKENMERETYYGEAYKNG